MKRHGFTLIELLVVIAIISILAAILFPVFSKAREKARQTTCASNEKQIGLAFMQYIQDYDESFGNTRGWTAYVYPYVKSTGVFTCPDDTGKRHDNGQVISPPAVVVSYMLNNMLSDMHTPQSLPLASKWSAPASTVLAAECDGAFGFPQSAVQDQASSPEMFDDVSGPNPTFGLGAAGAVGGRVNTSFQLSPLGRHNNGSNFIFLDGHVKWLLPTQLSSGYPNTLPGCNQDDTPAVAGCNGGSPLSAGTEGYLPNGVKPAGTYSPT